MFLRLLLLVGILFAVYYYGGKAYGSAAQTLGSVFGWMLP